MNPVKPMQRALQTAAALLLLCGCDGRNADRKAISVDARSIVDPPVEVIDDSEQVELYAINDMAGLIEDGDELMVMVFGGGAREAAIRAENMAAGLSSFSSWMEKDGIGSGVVGGRFLRIPDVDDESGSRFYYFERDSHAKWQFRAICTGAWESNPAWPPTCQVTYPVDQKIVAITLTEPVFLRHQARIVEIVLATLSADGVIDGQDWGKKQGSE